VTPLATFIPRPPPAPEITPPVAQTPAVDAARVVSRGVGTRRAVALTFDAGSGDGNTAEILRVLREHNIRATFGITGVWGERYRDLLFAIAADGHQIINHTYSHTSFTGRSTGAPPLTPEERALELSRTEVTVYRYTSQSTLPYFRPPYGDYDDSVLRDVAASGYDTVVMWSLDTLGWNGATADEIASRSIAGAEPGVIYVMHVGSASQDAAALPRILQALQADNYRFETVAQILTP
jgi:peptidoglycan/xylan/chitin deacetylase (PgdA/CDA1 family)